MGRSYVPFDGMWSMAIEVPVSYLLRDGDLAWTCGQLALDAESTVLHPGDLARQSAVVVDYITQILGRAGLPETGIARLYLYHAAPNAGSEAEMVRIFTERFGTSVQLQPIAVPHFYYDGVLLEVDVWWEGEDQSEVQWRTAATIDRDESTLSEHLVVPTAQLGASHDVPDPGAVIDGGANITTAAFLSIALPGQTVPTEVVEVGDVITVIRRAGAFAWVHGRCTDSTLDLVAQTEAIMNRFDDVLPSIGLDYGDVAKSTTHYVGGSSAEELHGNMSVRNRRYTKPGPASTGLPVYGFADPGSKVVVDLTLVRRSP